ncbi:MAG TPA: hypothetical protein VLJ15_01875, partial [Gammaproteobacteria bacterium]|nr:hypothetical protein [Gammaproteobacteria bacterium]
MADKVAVTTKQKVIGVLTVVILAFIIYEVIGLFSTEKAAEPVIVPAKPAAGEKTPKPAATAQTNRGTEQPQLTTVNALTAPGSNIDFQKQREQQEAYLDSVNQLQLLRVKREIAETNQAIAAARLATETANKNMSDLLT